MGREIIHKGRIRNFIGRLASFDDLPMKNKLELKEIKKFICENLNKDIEISLFGSFYHGFSDDFSDYDLILSEKCDLINISEVVKEKLGYDVDFLYYDNKISEIIIP
jgi:predicted nucleotidyltransferase